VTLNDVLKKWSHQAGCFDGTIPKEIREKSYLDSLMAVFSMVARHHTELEDGEFVRAFRFFKDAGFTKRLSLETSIAERYGKLERTEPGFEKKCEPKPEPVPESVPETPPTQGCFPDDITETATPENNMFKAAEKKIKECKHEFELDGGPCIHCGLTWIEINSVIKSE
jgi:hypothetical protein